MSEAQSASVEERWQSLIPDIRERIQIARHYNPNNHSFTNALLWSIPLVEEILQREDITRSLQPHTHHAVIDLSPNLLRSLETQDPVGSPVITLFATGSDRFRVSLSNYRRGIVDSIIYSYSFDLKQTVGFLSNFVTYMPYLSAENDWMLHI